MNRFWRCSSPPVMETLQFIAIRVISLSRGIWKSPQSSLWLTYWSGILKTSTHQTPSLSAYHECGGNEVSYYVAWGISSFSLTNFVGIYANANHPTNQLFQLWHIVRSLIRRPETNGVNTESVPHVIPDPWLPKSPTSHRTEPDFKCPRISFTALFEYCPTSLAAGKGPRGQRCSNEEMFPNWLTWKDHQAPLLSFWRSPHRLA